MNTRLRKVLRINMLAFTLLLATSIVTTSFVMGISDVDKSVSLASGYATAYTYTVENYKNQKFTIEVEVDETAASSDKVSVFCVPRHEWLLIQDNNSLHVMDIPAEQFLFNDTADKFEILVGEDIVIPDWEEWTFVILNLTGDDLTILVMIKHQHILWWLWVVLPSIIIIGLVTYGIVGNLTKYERAKMNSEKAISKLGTKNEAERQRAAYWLISNGTGEDIGKLKELLHDDNSLNRANAAFAIGGISKRIKDKTLARVLIDRYNIETDEMVKEEIVNGLCDIADESSLEMLEQYLKIDHNEILRFNIAEALEEIASPKSISILVEILNGINTDSLKIACSRALEKIATKERTNTDALIAKYS